jgi:hypothetical protein
MSATFSCGWTGRPISENGRVVPGKHGGQWRGNSSYGAFVRSMTWELTAARMRQRWSTTGARVSVLLAITCPTGMDHHNLIKPALDALQRAGIIENDRDVVDVRAVRTGNGKDGRIDFTVAVLASERVVG